jgi:hypothetical protein
VYFNREAFFNSRNVLVKCNADINVFLYLKHFCINALLEQDPLIFIFDAPKA